MSRNLTLGVCILGAVFGLLQPLRAQDNPLVSGQIAKGSEQESQIRSAVEQFYKELAKRDFDSAMASWCSSAPKSNQSQKLQQLFNAGANTKIEAFKVGAIALESTKANVRVSFEMIALDQETGRPIPELGQMERILDLAKEAETWKICQEADAFDVLALKLTTAKDAQERAILLAQDKELLVHKLVRALVKRGGTLKLQGDHPEALKAVQVAYEIAEQIGDLGGKADSLRVRGLILLAQGDLAAAGDCLKQSLSIAQDLPDKVLLANVISDTGRILEAQGDYAAASERYEKSLALSEAAGFKTGIASVLNNLGNIYDNQGNYAKALEAYQRSLTLGQDMNDQMAIANALHNQGLVYRHQGDRSRALESFQKSLHLSEQLNYKAGVAASLNNIGVIYDSQGNPRQALEYFQRSLQIRESIGDKEGVAIVLSHMGISYSSLGDLGHARESQQKSLAMFETTGDKEGIANDLGSLAEIYRDEHDFTHSLEAYQKALSGFEELGDRDSQSGALLGIGRIKLLEGKKEQALEFANRAATIAREIGDPDALWQASTTLGEAYRALNRPLEARAAFEEAISTVETLRQKVAGDEEEQQRFFAESVAPYREIVDLLTVEKKPELALVYAERAKGRVLLDVLHSGRAKITKSMTAEEIDSEEKLERQLFNLNSRMGQLSGGAGTDAHSLEELKNQLEKARLQSSDFQTRLYARHPELQARRGEARPISLEEASTLLPDRHTALIEFVVGTEKTDVFVLTKRNVQDSSASDLMAYSINISAEELAKKAERFREQLAQRELAFRSSAKEFYDLLLKPAENQLRGKSSLLIVPDGALWELPFQALRNSSSRYLVEDAAVAYVSSLSVLREMNHFQKSTGNEPVLSASSDLLAMGNPTLKQETNDRAKFVYRGESLGPLPEAAQEVKMLQRLYGPNRSRVYIGPEAREDIFKSEAGKYRVLHLASHGIFNDTNPMYSHILLSAGDAGGNEDGLLEAWEIMRLDLKANLVVLSACETARGRVSPGEGVIGLTWAFFVAGVPTALVSQWKVESASTSKLMVAFHGALANADTQSGFPYRTARALQLAELQLLHSQQYAHPFYWAGFVLVGDPH